MKRVILDGELKIWDIAAGVVVVLLLADGADALSTMAAEDGNTIRILP